MASIKRIYDPAEESDGYRVLVDRLWPRGLARENARIEHWLRELAPSSGLRKWFGHDPARWDGFRDRYRQELRDNPEAVERCLEWCRKGPVTLLYGARDEEHNQAVVLAGYLRQWLGDGG